MLDCDLNARRVWGDISDFLRDKLCIETYEQWFQSIIPVDIDNEELILGVSDDFFAEWLMEHYQDMILDAAYRCTKQEMRVKFLTGYLPSEQGARNTQAPKTPSADFEDSKPVSTEGKANDERSFSNFFSRCTFDNYVVGEENRYAFAATMSTAQSPGTVYNPLYIYGGTGLGKTHLLQASGHKASENKPGSVIEYVTCENFLNHYVDSLKSGKHPEFRNRFREVDMLLVDDVHQLANKTQLQEEFFNTFNTLHHKNKQIILTSDKRPGEIKGLESRLVSRFESGVTTEITPPGFETRLAILQMKQEDHLTKLDDEVLRFIASRIVSNIRRLEGALLQLVAFSSAMSNCHITIDIAERLLGKVLEEESIARNVSVESIQRKVAERFDLRITDLTGSKRPKNIAIPRMIAMYLCRKLTDYSYPELGEAFGGRNHATIIHAFNKIGKEKDEKIRRNVSSLLHELQA